MLIKRIIRLALIQLAIYFACHQSFVLAEQMILFGGIDNESQGKEVLSSFIYADSIKEVDGNIRLWTLINYKKPMRYEKLTYSSAKNHDEVDCKKDRVRTLGFILFSKGMGQGDVIAHDSREEGSWHLVAPGSVGAELLNIACKRYR